jgi:thiamine-monophosphate kinase
LLVPSTVADRSERDLIARIRDSQPANPDWLLVGIGDDAAVVEPERNRVDVLTVDALVEGIHFDRAFVPPRAIGHRALAVNLSDLAAMGAAPRLALLSMAVPPTLPLADFEAIVDAFTALARQHSVHVVGGNLTRSPGPLMIDVTAIGTVKRRQALTRSGARPGDDLYVSGTIGSAAAGLEVMQRVASRQSSVLSQQSSVASLSRKPSQADSGPTTDDSGPTTDDSGLTSDDSGLTTDDSRLTTDDSRLTTDDLRLTTAFLFPTPRVALGLHLARNKAASACMDLSDGLVDGLRQISEASRVGMTIDLAALPIDPQARAVLSLGDRDAVVEALVGGDDYELLFAVRPRTQRRLGAARQRGGITLTRIGRCTAEPGIVLRGGATSIDVTALRAGYRHFR